MSDAEPVSERLPTRRKLLRRLVFSLIPLVIFLWILRKVELPLYPRQPALQHVNMGLIGAYAGWFLVALLIRGVRWRWLVTAFSPMSLQLSLLLTSIGNAAIVLLPMRSGEVVRPLLAKRHGISPLAVLSTIGAERIIDGFCVGLIVTVSLSMAPSHPQGLEILPLAFRDPSLVTRVARFALIGFSSALAIIALFYVSASRMERLIARSLGRLSSTLALRVTQLLESIASGLGFLRSGRAAAIYIAMTAIYWLLQLASVHLLLHACGFANVRFLESCAITGVFALGFLLPSPPGFFGAFQTTFYAGLLLYFPVTQVTNEGSSVVFFAYAIQLGVTLLLGLLCYWRELSLKLERDNNPSHAR